MKVSDSTVALSLVNLNLVGVLDVCGQSSEMGDCYCTFRQLTFSRHPP